MKVVDALDEPETRRVGEHRLVVEERQHRTAGLGAGGRAEEGGKPYCRCHTDPTKLHGPYLSWTRKVNNKTVTRSVSAEEADRYREWMGNARRLRQLVAELEALAVRQVEGPSGQRGT